MGIRIDIDSSRRFVRVVIEGDVTAEAAREFSASAIEFGEKHGLDRIFVDSRKSRNVLSPTDNYYYAYRELGAIPFNRMARTAILTDKDDFSHDFVETVSQNAGYNVRVFKDEPQAIAWLSEED